ncbi:MAG TPA: tetratricopeptide repeat protein, partial [Thermoanaerobaculia bacterium]|nr:tetratricopeptide repeat protein [Thermoanaerobaculia bacterium]
MTASPRNLAALLSWFLLALVAGCTTTAPEPAQPMSEQSRFLVDPRIGFPGEASRRTQRDFESGWLMFREGRLASAERELQALLRRDPDYRPAVLGLAAVALERGQIERTASLIAQAQQGLDSYLAARIYEAELEVSRGNLEQALGIYDQIVQQPQAPPVSVRRREQLKIYLIDRLLAAAKSAVEPL